MRKRGRLRPADPAMVVAESLTWAAIMMATVGSATQLVSEALGATLWAALSTAIATLGPVDKLVMAAGAGFHEEIVFRAGLLGGGAAMLTRISPLGRKRALLLAMVASSVAFSLVHHLGPLGEAFAFTPFLFRTFAGVFLGTLYLVRGFAVVVYTHALYDVLVFFIL
jgi:membrane protease YdiL (CAAX protease family)